MKSRSVGVGGGTVWQEKMIAVLHAPSGWLRAFEDRPLHLTWAVDGTRKLTATAMSLAEQKNRWHGPIGIRLPVRHAVLQERHTLPDDQHPDSEAVVGSIQTCMIKLRLFPSAVGINCPAVSARGVVSAPCGPVCRCWGFPSSNRFRWRTPHPMHLEASCSSNEVVELIEQVSI